MCDCMKKSKVTIVGAGYVGASVAYALVLCNVCDEIVFVNRNVYKAKSEIDDIRHGFPFVSKTQIRVGDYSDCEDSQVIVIATGRNRKPGESRLDLACENSNIVKSNIDQIKKYYKNAVILIVTNPIDVITYKVSQWMNVPYGRIFGTGCILDSSRFVRQLADYFQVDISDVRAIVIGEHGEGQVLLWSNVTICGESIDNYCKNYNKIWNDEIKKSIEDKVRNMGMSIIAHKGRTQYGIATCVADIVNAVICDKKIKIPVSSMMQGEYGIEDVALSYPSVIGKEGIEERLSINLNKYEITELINNSEKLKKLI